MRRFALYILFSIPLFIMACGNGAHKNEKTSSRETDQLKEEVMSVHDEVMPKMSEMNRISRKIKDIPIRRYDDIDTAKMKEHLRNLKQAHEGMMEWMAEYNPDIDTMPEDKARRYLEEQKKEIQKVADRMNSSLSNAKSWYENAVNDEQ